MSLEMDASRAGNLISFVDQHVRSDGCDHTHRFAKAWANRESIDWPDLLDVLEANGCYCDCETVLNLPVGQHLVSPSLSNPSKANPWFLPPTFACKPSAIFTKVIVCQAGLGRNTYATDGELLVPAPKGAKSRRRVRKS